MALFIKEENLQKLQAILMRQSFRRRGQEAL